MQPILLSLPDELADWRGTAAELADKCNEVLAGVPSLADDAGSANERLVRHYVQVGVLTAPEREGREALFGLRQIIEFLATRYLLKDGWPLAKVAEIVRTTDDAGLTQLIPSERPRTRAEEVVAKYRGGRAAANLSDDRITVRSSRDVSAATFALTPEAPPASASRRAAVQQAMKLETPLSLAADISRRRVSLEENLKALGNRGRPARAQPHRAHRAHAVVPRATWTPSSLNEMSDETPAILGAALTQALQEERIQKGK